MIIITPRVAGDLSSSRILCECLRWIKRIIVHREANNRFRLCQKSTDICLKRKMLLKIVHLPGVPAFYPLLIACNCFTVRGGRDSNEFKSKFVCARMNLLFNYTLRFGEVGLIHRVPLHRVALHYVTGYCLVLSLIFYPKQQPATTAQATRTRKPSSYKCRYLSARYN